MSYPTKKYDVFISFRGLDTRFNFTSHLHSALCRESIRTYIDDNLKKGENMWPALSQAIQNSHIAIVVFSENYASSKWCLEELVKILGCRKNKSHRQVVISVFYEVDPSDIRHQNGSYRRAFAKHARFLGDKDKPKKISEWKDALREAANMSRWESRSRDDKNHSQVIEKIVQDVSQKLYLRYPIELEVEGLVGVDKICEYVESLLSKNKPNQLLKNVTKIGVWGMGGIGKTTIAKAVFSRLFPQFDSVCFLANVREESKRLGLTSLRGKLLSELLKEENPKFNPVESTLIKRRLSDKKVFIVLDDVEDDDQFNELCKGCNYAAPGSKLIITTRDRQLLVGKVDEIYDAKPWSFDASLELFCLHAFKQRFPQEGYEHLVKAAVDYAGGVPLALKVLGSNLYSKRPRFWEKELKKVKKYPYDRIQSVLRVSYNGLDVPQQKAFLDIAFFFIGENIDFVESILNACDFFATSGIEVLEDKALITISKSKRVQMHDLLQEMGLDIVRRGIEDPGKRSRLRDITEVTDVLQNKKGSDAIEGIALDLSHIDNLLRLSADTFDMMTKLRFLKLYIPLDKRSGMVEYPRVFNMFPDNLRYLEWHGYQLKSLPANFTAKMLVEIRMPHSHVTELWQGLKDVVNLEGLDLSECKQLKNLPDLSKAQKLKWVNLTGCESLLVVHPSVLSLDTLETLILDSCKKLKILKSEKHLRSLKNLSINGCPSLKEFSMSSDLILRLDLSKTGVEKLHPSIGNLTRLESLNLEGLSLRNLPNELSLLKYLRDLRISNCILVMDKQKLCVLFEGLTSLRLLYLKDCCKMCELPDNICNLSQLYELRLDGSSLERLPESIKHLNNLEILSLNNCMKLQCLPKLPPFIKEFTAANCSSLVTLSTLKNFAVIMRGDEKYISFENCLTLNGRSLQCITEGTRLTMMSALFQNKYVDMFGLKAYSYNYNLVKVCLPGSRVPRQFTYRTTDSLFTIPLPSESKLLGIILCAVLSPSEELKKHGARIWCQCYLPDGKKVGHTSTWYREAVTELNSDHVYIWCDSFHFDSIFEGSDERRVSFEFYVTDDSEEPEVSNIHTKECGVHLVFDSEDLRLPLRGIYLGLAADFDLFLEPELRSELGLDSKSQHGETSGEKECNDKNNQEWDLTEEYYLSEEDSRSSDCLFDVLRFLWRLTRN